MSRECLLQRKSCPERNQILAQRWVKAQGLRYQLGTHESQLSPEEEASDAFDFVSEIWNKINETSHEKNTLSIYN